MSGGDLSTFSRRRSHSIRDEEEQRTLREWSSRIERLNSIDSGTVEPQVSSAYSKGSVGYAGFYQYLTRNDGRHSNRNSRSSKGPQSQPPSKFEQWITSKKRSSDKGTNRKGSKDVQQQGNLDPAELKDISRCFQEADTDGEGWLDCEGLKLFMSLRGTPITHLDARRLLQIVDHKSQSYISYDQIMYLVAHCGLTTDQEVPLSSDAFHGILNRMRHDHKKSDSKADVWPQHSRRHHPDSYRPSTTQHHPQYLQNPRSIRPRPSRVIQSTIPMDDSKSFFEDMASEVQIKANEERLYKEYRRELRQKENRRKAPSDDDSDYEGPLGWKNLVLHSQDPSYHVPPIEFNTVRTEWEVKSCRGIDPPVKDQPCHGLPVGKKPPIHSACHLKIDGIAPKGLPGAASLCIPGRPQPFVVTQTELQVQLDKIRKKSESAEVEADLLFKAPKVKASESRPEL